MTRLPASRCRFSLSAGLAACCVFLLLTATARASCMVGDCLNGHGVFVFDDGSRYEGAWEDGRLQGRGTMTFADGGRYDGEWQNNQPNGQGTLTFAENDSYVGEFKDGLRHGTGTWTGADGRKYDGEWQEDLPHGAGTLIFADGSRYEGRFRHGERHGQGTFSATDGKRYTGMWLDGKLQGTWTPAAGNDPPTAPPERLPPLPTYASTTEDGVPLQAGPGAGQPVLRTLVRGYPLLVVRQESDWLAVTEQAGISGWVAAALVGPDKTVVVTAKKVKLRKGPGQEYPVVATAVAGDIFTLLATQGKWLNIAGTDNNETWIRQDLVWPPADVVDQQDNNR
ncbi:MAG: hypothetical protein A2521_16940 [Deltaproteobacteria bacterium RIFOXYD12_FULL_57_12]|nr:MAG: hypothetical protein A2521_16940 [Deltaproteobacteria bacterium RIFOXYD12_FULL_57_12]